MPTIPPSVLPALMQDLKSAALAEASLPERTSGRQPVSAGVKLLAERIDTRALPAHAGNGFAARPGGDQ